MKFTRFVYLFSMSCIIVSIFISCKNPMDIGGDSIEVIEPAPPFKVQIIGIEGEGMHVLNGSYQPWKIAEKGYKYDSIRIDTSGRTPNLSLSLGQYTPQTKDVIKYRDAVNAVLQSIFLRIDSLPLSEDMTNLFQNPQLGSGAGFIVSRSIFRPIGGSNQNFKRDTITERTITNRNGVNETIKARFVRRENPKDPLKPDYVIEVQFSIIVKAESEKQNFLVCVLSGQLAIRFKY